MSALASESSHWYCRDGSACYTVKSKDGTDRPTTLRDARKLDLVPSVTTITKLIDKPGLANWLQDQVLWAALTLPRFHSETDDNYIGRIKADARERGKKAAERGTALHADIERMIQGQEHGHADHCKAVEREMAKLGLNMAEGTAERSFAHLDGFGGKIDWHIPAVVCDFKSKDKIEEGKKLAWDEHCLQLAAYAHGLGIASPRCLNVFVGVDDCKVSVHEWSPDEISRGLEMFKLTLRLWQVKNNFVL